MFGNCTQSVYREEGQSSHNEDNDKRHYSESQRISLQCSGTLGNELLLSQQAGNGNLSDNRQESAKNKYNTTGPVPELSIISQSFKAGTIVSGTRCILIKLLTQAVESKIVQPTALAFHKVRMIYIYIT